MKKFTGLLLAISTQAFLVQPAFAQEERSALVPLPSIQDFTRGEDGWGFGLGLSVEYESAYEGSDEFGFEADPAGGAQWRKGDNIFFWAGEALGWRGLASDTWLLQAAVGFEEGREAGDSDDGRLDGLGDTDESVDVSFQARYAFAAAWRYLLDARILASQHGDRR